MKEKPVSERKDIQNQKGYILVLLNDDVNTFEHVIKSLVEICGHDPVQAEQCAVITHFRGSCEIKTGSFSQLTNMKRNLGKRDLNSSVKPL